MTMRPLLSAALCVALFAACKGTEATTTQPSGSTFVNTMCPIAAEAVDPDVEGVTFNGYTVGFCCGGCKDDWDEWSEQKKADFVAAAMR